MKKIKLALVAIALVTLTTPAFSTILVFNRSLSNQAGVGYDFVFNSWDYVTNASLHTQQKDSVVSFMASPDQYGQSTVAAGKSNVISNGLYWAGGVTNTATVKRNRGSLGTTLGTWGLGIFADQTDDVGTGTPMDSKGGVNFGKSSASLNFVMGYGVAYQKIGTETSAIEARTYGWIPTQGWDNASSDLIGWYGGYKTTTGGGVISDNADASVFYTFTLPLGDGALFWINPETGVAGANSLTQYKVAVPVMFAVPVTTTVTINAGYYPTFAWGDNNTFFGANGTNTDIYGFGMTVAPAPQLKMHFLLRSANAALNPKGSSVSAAGSNGVIGGPGFGASWQVDYTWAK